MIRDIDTLRKHNVRILSFFTLLNVVYVLMYAAQIVKWKFPGGYSDYSEDIGMSY